MAISTHDEAHESTDLDLKQGLMTKAVSTTIMRSSTQLFCPLASPAACVTHHNALCLLSNNKHVEMTDADHVPGCLILQHHTNRSSPAPSPQPYRVSLLCYFPFFFLFSSFYFFLRCVHFSSKPPIFFFFRTTLFSCCFRYFQRTEELGMPIKHAISNFLTAKKKSPREWVSLISS